MLTEDRVAKYNEVSKEKPKFLQVAGKWLYASDENLESSVGFGIFFDFPIYRQTELVPNGNYTTNGPFKGRVRYRKNHLSAYKMMDISFFIFKHQHRLTVRLWRVYDEQ